MEPTVEGNGKKAKRRVCSECELLLLPITGATKGAPAHAIRSAPPSQQQQQQQEEVIDLISSSSEDQEEEEEEEEEEVAATSAGGGLGEKKVDHFVYFDSVYKNAKKQFFTHELEEYIKKYGSSNDTWIPNKVCEYVNYILRDYVTATSVYTESQGKGINFDKSTEFLNEKWIPCLKLIKELVNILLEKLKEKMNLVATMSTLLKKINLELEKLRFKDENHTNQLLITLYAGLLQDVTKHIQKIIDTQIVLEGNLERGESVTNGAKQEEVKTNEKKKTTKEDAFKVMEETCVYETIENIKFIKTDIGKLQNNIDRATFIWNNTKTLFAALKLKASKFCTKVNGWNRYDLVREFMEYCEKNQNKVRHAFISGYLEDIVEELLKPYNNTDKLEIYKNLMRHVKKHLMYLGDDYNEDYHKLLKASPSKEEILSVYELFESFLEKKVRDLGLAVDQGEEGKKTPKVEEEEVYESSNKKKKKRTL